MKRTKLLFLFLTSALVLCNFCGVFAAESPAIAVSSQKTRPGNEVTLTVSLSDNPGICTVYLAVHYDPDLVLIRATDAGLMHGAVFGKDLSQNPYMVTWDDSLAEKNTALDGALVHLTFRVKDTARPGAHPVYVTYDEDEIYDLDLKNVFFATSKGGVTVEDAPGGAVESVPQKETSTRDAAEAEESVPSDGKEPAPDSESEILSYGENGEEVGDAAEREEKDDFWLWIAIAASLAALILLFIVWKKKNRDR